MIGARILLRESLTKFNIVGFIIVIIGITLTATNQLSDKSNSFVGLSFAILAAIFGGLEGVIYKMLLNANIAINNLLF
ncbi:EamA/RhaT family transporter, partial [Francisella tularensis subsp. holarctica]|nr:EamA/RhaT family transporter [Francisella tularensis subsp. holarctica]